MPQALIVAVLALIEFQFFAPERGFAGLCRTGVKAMENKRVSAIFPCLQRGGEWWPWGHHDGHGGTRRALVVWPNYGSGQGQ